MGCLFALEKSVFHVDNVAGIPVSTVVVSILCSFSLVIRCLPVSLDHSRGRVFCRSLLCIPMGIVAV